MTLDELAAAAEALADDRNVPGAAELAQFLAAEIAASPPVVTIIDD